jgi:hypothetical protein
MAKPTKGRSDAKRRDNREAEVFIGVRGELTRETRCDRLAKSSPLALLSKNRSYACFPFQIRRPTISNLMNPNFNRAAACHVAAVQPLSS